MNKAEDKTTVDDGGDGGGGKGGKGKGVGEEFHVNSPFFSTSRTERRKFQGGGRVQNAFPDLEPIRRD